MQQGTEEQVYAEARRVLRALLIGMDPETHTRLSSECVVMQPEVKTALALGVEALKDTEWLRRWRKKRGQKDDSGPVLPRRPASDPKPTPNHETLTHAGSGWSKQEDRRLTAAFYEGRNMSAIAAAHGRTDRAIEARLVRLGLVDNRREARGSLPSR